MKSRSGLYIIAQQENLDGLCDEIIFDSLTLTLKQDGTYWFNYKPCFSKAQDGHWNWDDDMVGTFTTFDKINDSLILFYPIDKRTDTILLKSQEKKYLVFVKKDNSKQNYR